MQFLLKTDKHYHVLCIYVTFSLPGNDTVNALIVRPLYLTKISSREINRACVVEITKASQELSLYATS